MSIFWLTLISQIGILSFIDTFAAFFGPLFGVMIADYYLIKKVLSLISKGNFYIIILNKNKYIYFFFNIIY